MILHTTDDGYELTSEDVSVLLYMAGQARGTRPKTQAEEHAEDVLWSLGWLVPTRVLRSARSGIPDRKEKP